MAQPSISSSPIELPMQPQTWKLLLGFLLSFFGLVLIRNAWVCDDAYITYRTIYHFVNGYGLRFNVFERVQAYTHPLWLFVNAPVYALMRDAYLSSIVVSLTISFGCVYFALRHIAVSRVHTLLLFTLLILSKAFMDFCSSGLENPLTYALAAVFVWVYYAPMEKSKQVLELGLICCLAMLNRLDTGLLFLPALAYKGLLPFQWKHIRLLVLAFLPLVLWELFSLLYYGSLFPNTALAKLNTGISLDSTLKQGVFYYLNSIDLDPVSLLLILSTGLLIVIQKQHQHLPILAGIGLYLFYVLWIGGDFMSGRFFAAPFWLAALLMSRMPIPKPFLFGFIGIYAMLGLSSSGCPIFSNADYHVGKIENPAERYSQGIVDERAFYNPTLGLLKLGRKFEGNYIEHDLRQAEKALSHPMAQFPKDVKVFVSIGQGAYRLGPEIHVIDRLALSDPLLARLPMQDNPDWRVGHYFRTIPEGYTESIKSQFNRLQDPKLAKYYDKVMLITGAPLFYPGRLHAIFEWNIGRYNDWIDKDLYRKSK